ncbi:hypothetical protein ACWERV_06655 [Streptomyces sp. NPDC004031]
MRVRQRWWATLVAGSALTAVTACGGGSGGGEASHSPSAQPTVSFPTQVLRAEAGARLTPSKKVVMHGETTAKDGLPETAIHTPADKKTYVFEAACAGKGSLQVDWRVKVARSGPDQWITCGEEAQRFTFLGGDLLSMSLPSAGMSGIVVWQVIQQSP